MMDSVRAVLYMRVSTDEQAQRGYSIPDQRRELRAYAEREGYRVVEEVLDDGYSGASPDRPGLHRIMELAEAGAMDVVLALKRNRLFRSRLYRLMWDRDLKELGVEMRALDDTGNRFGDAMTDEFAEWEREQITERTMRGRLQKARQGKLIPVYSPGYGYRYNEDKTGLVVNEAEMQIVYRILEEIASGATIHRVTTDLNRDNVPGPRSVRYLQGAPRWNRVTVRNIILCDLHFPYTAAEVAEQVAPEVAATLDENARYGILRYAKRRTTPLSGDKAIAIPVPSSGLPRDLVEKARDAIRENRRSSYNGGRRWPLSGGIARCVLCGARMETSTSTGRKGEKVLLLPLQPALRLDGYGVRLWPLREQQARPRRGGGADGLGVRGLSGNLAHEARGIARPGDSGAQGEDTRQQPRPGASTAGEAAGRDRGRARWLLAPERSWRALRYRARSGARPAQGRAR